MSQLKLKGRAKEAAGAVTDNDELRREGKIDQVAGETTQKAAKGIDKARDAATDDCCNAPRRV